MSDYFVNITKKAKFKTLSTIDYDSNLDLFQSQLSITKTKEIYLEIVPNSSKFKLFTEESSISQNRRPLVLYIYIDVYLSHQEC